MSKKDMGKSVRAQKSPNLFVSPIMPSQKRLSKLGRLKTSSIINNLEEKVRNVINAVISNSDFASKYDISGNEPFLYAYTRELSKYVFLVEAFPQVQLPLSSSKIVEEFVYHKMFEEVIFRYTNERRKPNPVLIETKSSDFCYQLVIKFEAIPVEFAKNPDSHQLLHEFQVLKHIWEKYRSDLKARNCLSDHLIGFPMPFEFTNVVGSSLYDFPKMMIHEFYYYNIHGISENIYATPISMFEPGTNSKKAMSSLNYMSVERLGPNLPHLMDLMQSQLRRIKISTALKIYDQLISRLLVLHKYGIAHCDINSKSLSFGCKEASNVLYINSFDKAVLCRSNTRTLPIFHDRFVSHQQTKNRTSHFVYDLESAFYIFIYVLLDRLPWDSKINSEASQTDNSRVRVVDSNTRKTRSLEAKKQFWTSIDSFQQITKLVSYDFSDGLYRNFSLDLLETLYSKMKETINICGNMNPESFLKEIEILGSAPNNCYFGMRRVIASYFRFESVNQIMKDVTCTMKVEMLIKQGAKDKRIPWNLTNWCWNQLDADPEKRR